MKVKRIKWESVFDELSDESFDRLKHSISMSRFSIMPYEQDSDAEKLLRVILHGANLSNQSRWYFAWLMNIMMEKNPLHTGHLLFYCEILEKMVKSFHKDTIEDRRYLDYFNNVINKRIPRFKESVKAIEKQGQCFDQLVTIYKICTCLIRCSSSEKKHFSMDVSKGNLQLIPYYMDQVNKDAPLSSEEYACVKLITSIIQVMLWDQEGLTGKKVNQNGRN